MFDLRNKVIAITGAGSGMGLATAELLASYGAKVSLADINAKAVEQVQERITKSGGHCMAFGIDIANSQQVDSWVETTVQQFGALDGAVNLAGIIPDNFNIDRIEDLDDKSWLRVLDVNLNGTMYCMRAQLRNMNRRGSIVNTSSVAGLGGFAKNAAYVASKHAIIGLTKSAAKEVGDREIRVNCLAPGVIDTPMLRGPAATSGAGAESLPSQQPLRRKGHPSEVGDLVAWLLSDQSTFITGTVQVIDGGFIA